MLPTVLTLRETRLRLHLKVVRLNQEQPTRTHTRVGSDGQTKTVITRPKRLCDGAKTTAVLLLQRAREHTLRMLSNPLYWDQLTATRTNELPDVPPIEVNGRELSEKRGLTDRALRNHLAQLKQVGIIVNKKFRGTRASFHVWMNPELLWAAPLGAVKTAEASIAVNSHTHSVSLANGKKVPDTEVLETLETPEREITNEDKLVIGSTAKLGTRNPLLETEARNGRAFRRKKNGAGGGPITNSQKVEPTDNAAQDPVLLKKMSYVLEFWQTAKELVYPGRQWTSEQVRQAKNAIWTGVYNNFYSHGEFNWESFQLSLLRRLQLVQNHFQLHPGRFAPLPYAHHKPGAGYFDKANANGFIGTITWLKQENKRKQSLIVERALRTAMTEIDQHKAIINTPEIKLRAHERVRSFSLFQLIKHHENVLKQLGNTKALDRFYAKVANKLPKSLFKTICPR